ncbi:hypothetical protein [Pleomorphochaeta sp. DL1XJH-081]|uniref:hypothetical protein n=1 Tax=Pleomorphochaeta sp. DL1XJH-081 TaxID=3409690 RepID=UPI003BB723AC
MKTSLRMGLVFMVVFLLCSASPLFAELITIDWEWDAADEDVVAFRYQLDAEDPDGWTVVEASVNGFTFGPVEDTSYHTLYVQQSYDSENWSPSALLSYDPVEFGVSMPIPEEAVKTAQLTNPAETTIQPELEETDATVVTTEPGEIEEPIDNSTFDDFVIADGDVGTESFEAEEIVFGEPVQAMPIATPVQDNPARKRIDFFIGVGGKADNLIWKSAFDPDGDFANPRTRILPSLTADFVYTDFKPNNKAFDLGIRAGFGFTGYEIGTTPLAGIDLHGMVTLEYPISERFLFDISGGLSFMFTGKDIHTPAKDQLGFFLGPVVQLNGRYLIDERWSVGLQAETRLLFGGNFKPYELTGIVRLGVGYDF